MTSNKLRSTSGCLTCRQRHLKCDEGRPICWRCKVGSRECVLPARRVSPSRPTLKPRATSTGSVRLRVAAVSEIRGYAHIRPANAADKPHWRDTDLNFLNHIPEGESGSRYEKGSPESNATPSAHLAVFLPPPVFVRPGSSGSEKGSNVTLVISSDQDFAPDLLSIKDDTSSTRGTETSYEQTLQVSVEHGDIRKDNALLSFSFSSLNTSEQEEYLMGHYTRTLGRWFLQSDAGRHYTITVPNLARSSPILMKAISAFAARHMSGVSDFDPSVAEKFHEQCIRLLIPALSDPDVAADDSVLAALVILRVYEQMTVRATGDDREHHLLGTSAFVRSVMRNPVSISGSGLQDASFWGCVRQCLYVACVHRQPLKFEIASYQIEMTLSGTSTGVLTTVEEESAWCRSIHWILAEVVDFCFGRRTPTLSLEEAKSIWNTLLAKVEMWDANKPNSFLPIAMQRRDPEKRRWFPEPSYGSDWLALSSMYALTAHILLAVYDPAMRNISIGEFGSYRARQQLESKVLIHARLICGIMLANPGNVPAIITLCHSVFAFASFFTHVEERKLLVEILQRSEREEAWPTAWIVKALKEDWDWR